MPNSAHSPLRFMVGSTRKFLKRMPLIDNVQPLKQSSIFSTTGAVIVYAWPIWFPQGQFSISLPKIAALAEMLALVELNFFCDDVDRWAYDHILDLMSEVIHTSVTSVSTIRSRHTLSESEDLLLSAMPASSIGTHLSLFAYCGEGEMSPVHALAEFIGSGFEWLREFAAGIGGLTSTTADVQSLMKRRTACIFENRSVQLGYPPGGPPTGGGTKSTNDAAYAMDRPKSGPEGPFDEVLALLAADADAGRWDGVIRAVLTRRGRPVKLERYHGKALL
jgi:hypothetical protein